MLIFSKLADLCVYLLSHLYCRLYITAISTSFSKACAFNGYTPSPQTPQMYYLFIYLLFIYLSLLFMYSCLPHPTSTSPHPLPPTLNPSPLWLCPWVFYTCSLMNLSLLCPVILLPSSLCLLSVCSLFQCFWLYFACLFVLLIRFH